MTRWLYWWHYKTIFFFSEFEGKQSLLPSKEKHFRSWPPSYIAAMMMIWEHMRSGDPHLKIYHSEETLNTPRQHKTQQNKKLRLAITMCWDCYFLGPNIFNIILLNFIQFYIPLSRKWVFCNKTKKRHFNTFKPSKYYFTISNRNKSIIWDYFILFSLFSSPVDNYPPVITLFHISRMFPWQLVHPFQQI